MSQEMARGFGHGAEHFQAPEAIAEAVIPLLNSNTTVLVKGSRFMRMERVVKLLMPAGQSKKA
jgi:UDP-N-acetylmuramyl pentapeptide synthase